MRFRTALCLGTLFLACFTVAAWSTPVPDRLAPGAPQPAPDNQSLSGKIASIEDTAFALEVAKGKEVSTVQFLVDDQTKVEGQLTVGARATVEYRSNAGNNIAVRVVIMANSGMSLY
jgi:hypothetical protein